MGGETFAVTLASNWNCDFCGIENIHGDILYATKKLVQIPGTSTKIRACICAVCVESLLECKQKNDMKSKQALAKIRAFR